MLWYVTYISQVLLHCFLYITISGHTGWFVVTLTEITAINIIIIVSNVYVFALRFEYKFDYKKKQVNNMLITTNEIKRRMICFMVDYLMFRN
jgi:hypothetical protein